MLDGSSPAGTWVFCPYQATSHPGESINSRHHAWDLKNGVGLMYLSSTGEAC